MFFDALAALSEVTMATKFPRTRTVDGVEDKEGSEELQRRMRDDFFEALREARRALAVAAPLCPDLVQYFPNWSDEIQSPQSQAEIQAILRRGLRRALRRGWMRG